MEKAINRQRVLFQHLQPTSSGSPPSLSASVCAAAGSSEYQTNQSSDHDVVIVAACRTAICKANKGGFKDTHAENLLAPLLKVLLEKTQLNPNEVGDIVVGTVLAPGSQRAIECRMAAFYAGFPETVPVRTVNRQCSSGLQAVADVAAAIKAGYYDIGIGAGLESMTLNKIGWEGSPNPKAKLLQQVQDCYLPMGITSENVAERYGITKEEQDQASVISHKRAAAAVATNKFNDEIVPVTTKIMDPKTGAENEITVSIDEGIRPETSLLGLAKLKPAFKKGGSTTAGNASQISDGAGAVLLMRRNVAKRKGLPILGIFRSFVAIGVDPAVMGIGPAVAIPAAVRAAGLQIKDIDLYEINEAFASQYVYCIKELGLDPEKVNVNGGAIALGHPLGATDRYLVMVWRSIKSSKEEQLCFDGFQGGSIEANNKIGTQVYCCPGAPQAPNRQRVREPGAQAHPKHPTDKESESLVPRRTPNTQPIESLEPGCASEAARQSAEASAEISACV